jgi:hypothetical protein
MPSVPRPPRAVAVSLARPAVPPALELAGWAILALALAAALALR